MNYAERRGMKYADRRGTARTMAQAQIVYTKPPADGALPDPADTFNLVHTPFEPEAMSLQTGEVLAENQYLSIDPYHRFGLYDPTVTRSHFPVTTPGTVISTYGISRVLRSANPDDAVGDLLYSWVRWERFTVVDEPNLKYLHGLPGQRRARQARCIEEPAQHRRHGHHHSVLPQRIVGAPGSRDARRARSPAFRRTHEVQDARRRRAENLPAAFYGMFTGQNFGKTAVKV
jgi:NADPH-dependent curcumin reductase CurA